MFPSYMEHFLILFVSVKTKIPEFAYSVDLDEVAHFEPPHLALHCLPFSLLTLNTI